MYVTFVYLSSQTNASVCYICLSFLSDQRLEDPEATVMFVLVSEESEVGRIQFGCRDNTDRESWMKWLVRATGQNFDPQTSVPESQKGNLLCKKNVKRQYLVNLLSLSVDESHNKLYGGMCIIY